MDVYICYAYGGKHNEFGIGSVGATFAHKKPTFDEIRNMSELIKENGDREWVQIINIIPVRKGKL